MDGTCRPNDVIEHTGSDGCQRRVVVGDLLDTEGDRGVASGYGPGRPASLLLKGGYERDREDILADLEVRSTMTTACTPDWRHRC